MKQYLFNVINALDRLVNAILGGDPRMTLSGRMGRDIEQGKCRLCRGVCAFLSLIDTNHCARAWVAEQTPVDGSSQVAKQ